MARNRSENATPKLRAMQDCLVALEKYAPMYARYHDSHLQPYTYRVAKDSYRAAYLKMNKLGHSIGGTRESYSHMADVLREEIRYEYGTQQK